MIPRRLITVFIALLAVLLAGVAGYAIIEGWSFFDALYMTVITIASVGFMEVNPLSTTGRIFTIFLIFCGSATLIYGFSVLTAFVVEGELTDAIRRRKMTKALSRLQDHYIVCGMSATGKYIIDELVKTGRSFVVVDKNPERLEELNRKNILTVEGNASHDAALTAAGIDRAEGLFTALHANADNLLVVVTARGLNPNLKVIAQASDEEAERKLKQVGADRVVMPSCIGGLRMASEMIRPGVVTFLDTMLRSKNATIRVEEICVPDRSPFAGKPLADTGVLEMEGVSLVALVSTDSPYSFNPPRTRVVAPGDVMIVMGHVERIATMREKAASA